MYLFITTTKPDSLMSIRKMKFILKYGVFLFCFTVLDAVKFRCDYRHTNLGWFKYHEIPATWNNARLKCHLEGGILASPTTAEMKSFLLESFCKPETIFTGIHATFSTGDYYTVDGIPLAEIPHEWAPYEPNNKNNAESCLTLNSNGKFADVNCDEPHPYVCFKEQSHVDVTVCGTPDSEYHFYSETNKCYKFHTNRRTFARANFACSAEGGHLAIINSDKEAKVISQLYAKYPASKISGNFRKDLAFIGFSNWGESADWTTIHGQSLQDAGYDKFQAGEPNNSTTGEFCGSVHPNGFLNDLWCENHYIFICEKRPDYPAVCDNISSHNASKYIRVCADDIQGEDTQLKSNNKNEMISGPVF